MVEAQGGNDFQEGDGGCDCCGLGFVTLNDVPVYYPEVVVERLFKLFFCNRDSTDIERDRKLMLYLSIDGTEIAVCVSVVIRVTF
ncbi:hypothetical protein D3C81_1332920 [compost metagenome]